MIIFFKNRLININYFILIYFLLYFFILLIFIFEHTLTLLLSPIFPLLLMIYYFKGLSSIYDYRFIYLLSLLVWGGGKILSLIISFDDIDFIIAFVYVFLMFISPLLVLLFKFKINFIHLSSKNNSNNLLLLIWFLSCLILFLSKYLLSETHINFFIENIFRGLPIYFGAALILKNERLKGFVSFFSLGIIILTIIPYAINSYNRTAILLPFSVLFLSLFFVKTSRNFTFIIPKFKIFTFISFFLVLLFLADLTKQTNVSIFKSLELSITDNDVSNNIISKSNYFPEAGSAINYFNTLQKIDEHENGILFYQLISSIFPRVIFPEKVETDISKILFAKDISPQPLYFEIFLEPYYDSGILGVIFYFYLYLLLSSFVLNCINKNKNQSLLIFSKSLYFFSLVILFYSIRGPAISILQYLSIPVLIFVIQFFFTRRVKLD